MKVEKILTLLGEGQEIKLIAYAYGIPHTTLKATAQDALDTWHYDWLSSEVLKLTTEGESIVIMATLTRCRIEGNAHKVKK